LKYSLEVIKIHRSFASVSTAVAWLENHPFMFLLIRLFIQLTVYFREISELILPFIHHFWFLVLVEKLIDHKYHEGIKASLQGKMSERNDEEKMQPLRMIPCSFLSMVLSYVPQEKTIKAKLWDMHHCNFIIELHYQSPFSSLSAIATTYEFNLLYCKLNYRDKMNINTKDEMWTCYFLDR
jgi:hypothetical protein